MGVQFGESEGKMKFTLGQKVKNSDGTLATVWGETMMGAGGFEYVFIKIDGAQEPFYDRTDKWQQSTEEMVSLHDIYCLCERCAAVRVSSK